MANDDTVVELCIVLDSTGSMQEWIEHARETINSIIDKLVTDNASQGNTLFRVAVVGYRDYKDTGRFMEMEFTQSIWDVKAFL